MGQWVLVDRLDLLGPLDRWDLRDQWVPRARLVRWGLPVRLALKDLRGRLEQLVQLGRRDRRDLLGLRDRRVIQELQAPKEQRGLLVRLALKGPSEQLAPRACREQTD